WLLATGAWPAFVDVMFVWNREYFACSVLGEEPWKDVAEFLVRFYPWALVHAAAVPLACAALWRGNSREARLSPLLAGFYLAWLFQAAFFQHLFDYVHVAPILLGLTVLADAAFSRVAAPARLPIVAFMLFCM